MSYDSWKTATPPEYADDRDDDFEQPTMTCPKCKAELPDFDGFGVLAHTKPAYPDGCGFCRHASRDDGICNYCGHNERECIDCGDELTADEVALSFTTCRTCAATRREIR